MIKEKVHSACFEAVAAKCGYLVNAIHTEDDCGVDYRLIKQRRRRNGSGFADSGSLLDFQLKASKNWSLNGETITYQVENKTLDDIRERNRNEDMPLVLVLLCAPPEIKEIVSISDSAISIHEKMFWYHCNSLDAIENISSKTTIYIPVTQVFSSTTFCDIISNFGL